MLAYYSYIKLRSFCASTSSELCYAQTLLCSCVCVLVGGLAVIGLALIRNPSRSFTATVRHWLLCFAGAHFVSGSVS